MGGNAYAFDALDLQAWDARLGSGDLFLSSDWLKVIERVIPTPKTYLVTSDEMGRTAATTAVIGTSDSPWVLGRPDTLLGFAAADDRPGAAGLLEQFANPAGALLPTVVLGGRHMGHSKMPRCADADHASILTLIDDAIAFGAEHGARSLCLPFVDDDDEPLRRALESFGFLTHESGRYHFLDVPADGFDGYLAQFRSHRRQRIRADRKAVRDAGVEISLATLSVGDIAVMADLETQLLHKYGIAAERSTSESGLRQVLDVFGDRALAVTARDGDGLLGFGVFVRWRDELFARHAGFDYSRCGTLPLYFEMLYYRPIEEAADLGIRRLQYGLGSDAAKQSRGCHSVLQHSYILILQGRGTTDE